MIDLPFHLRQFQAMAAAFPFNCGASIEIKESHAASEPAKVVVSREVQLFRHNVVIAMNNQGCIIRDSKCYMLTVPAAGT